MQTYFPEIKKNFGFGMMRLPMVDEAVDIPQVKAMVDAFLAAGCNYFDTAHGYLGGKSELAIKECLTARYPRDAYVLANKLSGSCFKEEADLQPLFDSQLKNCGVDYFDFYLLHALSEERNQLFVHANAHAFARKLKEDGKVRHLGFSFHGTPEFLDRFLTEHPYMEFVQLQFNYVDYENPEVQSRACYEVCRKHQKPVMVMEPVKGGSLVDLPRKALDLLDGSPASYAIRFAAGFDGVVMVLSGMSNMEQVTDNLSFMENFVPLNEKEQALIPHLRTFYQASHRIHCTGCRYCVDGCPANIPIPELFSLMNQNLAGEGQPAEAYAKLSVHADACLQCGKCEKECPQHLDIRALLQEIVKAF